MSKSKIQNKSSAAGGSAFGGQIQISKQKRLFCHLVFVLCAYFVICALSFGFLCGCQSRHLYKDSRIMIGTVVEVISPDKNAAGIAFGEIKRIEDLLSKYQEDSEIAKLNRLGMLKVSPDTFYILQKSKEFWQISQGAFDITVGPLMDLWGFTEKTYSVPEEERIKKVLELVGTDKIIFHPEDNVVKFKVLGMRIDLGAIAKGYALDCAAKKLKEQGVRNCLINAGGQIYCLGDKFGQPWKVAIKNPRGNYRGFFSTLPQNQEKVSLMKPFLELKDCAVATSGDYEQYFIRGNKRYAHIFNPKTGYPVNSDVVSVTVIAPSGLTADALTTAIFVLGKKKGLELAKKFCDVKVKIIEKGQIIE